MASSKTTSLANLVEVLTDLCPRILVKLLLKGIEGETPNGILSSEWTLDHFLYRHQTSIIATTIGRKKHAIFFPGFGIKTALENWDIHMLVFVLENLLPNLPEDVKKGISRQEEILTLLWEKCRVNSYPSEEEIVALENEMEQIINTAWLPYIGREDIQRHTKSEIKRLKQSHSIIDPVTVVHNWHKHKKETKSRLTDVSQDLRQVSERVDRVISLKKYNEEKQRKAGKVVKPRDIIPDTNFVILPKGCSMSAEKILTDKLKKCFMSSAEEEHDSEDQHLVKAATGIKETIEQIYDLRLQTVNTGCVELVVKCETMSGLVRLLEDYAGGQIKQMFKPLEDEIKHITGFEKYSHEIVIFQEDYDEWMKLIAENIQAYLDELEQDKKDFEQTKAVRTIKDVSRISYRNQEALAFSVQNETQLAQESLRKAIDDGVIETLFEPLAGELKKSCGFDELHFTVTEQKETRHDYNGHVLKKTWEEDLDSGIAEVYEARIPAPMKKTVIDKLDSMNEN